VDISEPGRFVAGSASPGEVARIGWGIFALPVAVLAVSALLIRATPTLPGMLHSLRLYGPYATLGAGLIVSLAFKRGRALFAVLTLLLAYTGFAIFLAQGPKDFPARTVFAALWLFVPFNLALLSVLPERGALNTYGARRLILVLIELSATLALLAGEYHRITAALYLPLPAIGTLSSPIPHAGIAALAIALVVTVVSAVTKGGIIEAALAAATSAFVAACNSVGTLEPYGWFAAAGAVVIAGVLQDSYRMAFHDELTGLPGRRALNERLMGLDGHYAVAMIDVDHFKLFNDAWGHDVGDQVLKLVAARLRRVGGGGRAYRYGGEEFTVVFPGLGLPQALAQTEALRRDIEGYRFEIRARHGDRRRGGDPQARWTSLTVSIGVAGTSEWLAAPGAVMHAADDALYRAKQGGRNRVAH
jgi:diguanylate cyclase (GGDEF)-like protein